MRRQLQMLQRIDGTGQRIDGTRPAAPGGARNVPGDFQADLSKAMESERVRFTKHATQRLMIAPRLPESQEILRLGEAMERASAKGCRSSLILSKDMAYIVNIPSRTVVTAIDSERLKESVFTHIDSTVIM